MTDAPEQFDYIEPTEQERNTYARAAGRARTILCLTEQLHGRESFQFETVQLRLTEIIMMLHTRRIPTED